MNFPFILSALPAILICAPPLAAHHSFAAEFDANRTVRLSGVLTGVDWSNPHSHFYIDVKDVSWVCEAGGPGILMRHGVQKKDLKIGGLITVEGYPAKDGSHRLDARRITLPDGRTLFDREPGKGSPPPSTGK